MIVSHRPFPRVIECGRAGASIVRPRAGRPFVRARRRALASGAAVRPTTVVRRRRSRSAFRRPTTLGVPSGTAAPPCTAPWQDRTRQRRVLMSQRQAAASVHLGAHRAPAHHRRLRDAPPARRGPGIRTPVPSHHGHGTSFGLPPAPEISLPVPRQGLHGAGAAFAFSSGGFGHLARNVAPYPGPVADVLVLRGPPPARADGRFAPSPTGSLHLGNLRTALLAWLLRARGGRALPDPRRGPRPRARARAADRRAARRPRRARPGPRRGGAAPVHPRRALRGRARRCSSATGSSTAAGAPAPRSATRRRRRTSTCPRARTPAPAAT